MKKTILLVVFAFVGLTTFAQEKTTELRKGIKHIVAVQSGNITETSTFDLLLQRIPDRNKEAFKSELQAKVDAKQDKLVDIYFDIYTKEEIEGMVNFYNTPIGKKILDKAPLITEKSMEFTQSFMIEIQSLFQKYGAM